ncbi:MAG: 1-deoxy-D-xylulose-5-phosphate synthase [Caldisericia bacterium]|nr:1-deoxy-D-xylulose-5-phosphate synthase [Caldisericia bacterium]
MAILDKINTPDDLKKLNFDELKILSFEIRELIKEVVGKNGGHLSSNLGTVELIISLLYTFNPPEDKIIFDVGHQCYAYKILTGRKDKFHLLRKKGGLSGYPSPRESEYDTFFVGHASNSLSLSLGLASARDLNGESYKIVNIIGDGALTGGEIWEALNNLGQSKKDILIVLNDNGMSISKNVGAFSSYFSKLRAGKFYRDSVNKLNEILKRRGKLGESLINLINKFKLIIKEAIIPGIVFEELGIMYFGPFDGHNIPLLVDVFSKVKNIKSPRIVHIITKKGKGIDFAEEDPDIYHSSPPFLISSKKEESFSQIFGDEIVKIGKKDERVVTITAAMELGTGLKKFKETFPERFFDVGIAEEHAVTFAGGLAKGGKIPFVAIYSTFLQRAIDQILLDVSLQKVKVNFAVDRAGLVSEDGETHQGIFDIAYFSFSDDFVIMAPKDGDELREMLNFSLYENKPCVIRYPKDSSENLNIKTEIIPYEPETLFEGDDVLIISLGKLSFYAYKAVLELKELDLNPMLLNIRFANPLPIFSILKYAEKIKRVLILEEHFYLNGIGSKIIPKLQNIGGIKIVHLAINETFPPVGTREELLKRYKLDKDSIKEVLLNIIGKKIKA